jgi:hypothetical protein
LGSEETSEPDFSSSRRTRCGVSNHGRFTDDVGLREMRLYFRA